MTVECPACKTRYRVDASLVVAGETSFECCQEDCGHIFAYTPPVMWTGRCPEPDTEPVSSSSQPESARQNEHQGDREAESSVNAADAPGRVPAFVRQEIELPPPAGMDNRAGQTGHARQDEDDVPAEPDGGPVSEDAPDIQAEPLTMPEKAPRHGPESNAGPPVSKPAEPAPHTGHVEAASPPADKPPEALLSVRAVFAVIGSFVCGYALLSYAALSYPRQTKLALRQLPVVGHFFASEPFSARHIRLDKLSGSFWLSKDNRRVFAVAGTARNTASVSARLVQIEGTLYNGVGKQVGQQLVFCGHEANAALLESLTARDMDTIQKLVPPRDFHIPAGRAANCLLVFTRPPGSVSEVSGRVVSVQFEDT